MAFSILSIVQDIKPEAPETIKSRMPEKDWPSRGEIRLHHVGMRYRENLPLVLKNVTCTIKAGERIGIVGRTGSGGYFHHFGESGEGGGGVEIGGS